MYRLLACTLNLLIPGTGQALLGYWRLAFLIQGVLLGLVLILCWSRLVFEPAAILASTLLVGGVYVFSCACCFRDSATPTFQGNRNFILFCLFIIVCSTCFAIAFAFKDRWLGVHIYYVPTESMSPTLEPGQLILVDTWAYNNKMPTVGEVVVFQLAGVEQTYVKRITPWPDGQLQRDGLWYVMGDNRGASVDSRRFGGIKPEWLAGQVRLVLFSLDYDGGVHAGTALQTSSLHLIRSHSE